MLIVDVIATQCSEDEDPEESGESQYAENEESEGWACFQGFEDCELSVISYLLDKGTCPEEGGVCIFESAGGGVEVGASV